MAINWKSRYILNRLYEGTMKDSIERMEETI